MRKSKEPKVPADLSESMAVHLACRDFKHAWAWRSDFLPQKDEETRKYTTVMRVLVCVRCDAERRDTYTLPSLEHVRSTYVYPPGYLIPGNHGHIYVSEVRSELFKRFRERKGK